MKRRVELERQDFEVRASVSSTHHTFSAALTETAHDRTFAFNTRAVKPFGAQHRLEATVPTSDTTAAMVDDLEVLPTAYRLASNRCINKRSRHASRATHKHSMV